MLTVKQFTCNPFGENTYIVADPENRECIIIDCGALGNDELSQIDQYITEQQLNPIRLIATHGHFDHNFGVGHIYEKYQLKVEIHQRDEQLLHTMVQQADSLAGIHLPLTENIKAETFTDDFTFTLGGCNFSVIPTPGHTKGSVCFYSAEAQMLFSGDTLFKGTIGRTDLPYGSMFEMTNSLRRLCQLPDNTAIYPGHGPSTSLALELSSNPFLDR